MRVYIGFDERETVAYHVLAHSIIRRATRPVSLTPLIRGQLRALGYQGGRDEMASTDFADTRFLVPFLAGYKGKAVFMDCDMLARDDLTELMDLPMDDKAVLVRQHDHRPRTDTKFLGAKQTTYRRKNWSSLIVFDCAKCSALTPSYVAAAGGLSLHQFEWLRDDQIGELPYGWNHLVGYETYDPSVPLVHFTEGTPCFDGYRYQPYAEEWFRELYHLQHYEGRGDGHRTDKGDCV